MDVTFNASIKEVSNKLLVSGDMSTRFMLEADNLLTEIKQRVTEIQDSGLNKSREVKITLSI